jgi:hypothetical protein
MELRKSKDIVWNVGGIVYAAGSLLHSVDGEWADSMRHRIMELWEEITEESSRLGDEYIAQLEKVYGGTND